MKPAYLFISITAMSLPALADDDHAYDVRNPAYQAECGSCHVSYPPRLLPARSWRALMSGLDKHFGTDASLDAKNTAALTQYLEQNAGRDRRPGSSPVLRITETRWFVHEHDDVSARTWKHPQVKSASNCTACHVDAERGDYSEHNIRLPR